MSGEVYIGRAKQAPHHTGVFNRDFARYMCRFVCLSMPKCIGGITWPKNAHAQFWAVKNDQRHQCYSFLLLYMDMLEQRGRNISGKKRSLSNEKLKARASETDEQRKERLRIRLEKDREKGEPKNYKRKR